MEQSNILIIRHGALGDIILNTPGFAAIRAAHPQAHIVLLTTKPYAELLAASPYFNEIWVDAKPKLWQWRKLLALRTQLRSRTWAWVYDLQTSTRSTNYYRLFQSPKPNFSGIHPRMSHAYTDPARHQKHSLENLQIQLEIAGISVGDAPDIGWMKADVRGFALPKPYALLVPGGAAHRPEKRWPVGHYVKLAQALIGQGVTPVLLGTAAESEVLDAIATHVPQVIHLGGKTTIPQIAELARGATLAVGNDTGPMHVIAAANCPSTVLFSVASNPTYSKPIGRYVTALQKHDLRELSVERVLASLGTVS